LDPIDGTKGFLRGGQYAVCLALIVDSVVQLGVMGCPNLPLSSTDPDGEKGALFVAVRGLGAEQVNGQSTTGYTWQPPLYFTITLFLPFINHILFISLVEN
jgi:3'(2'), 5'-bisphosphate nucleotidase